jgi:hypothetical protein
LCGVCFRHTHIAAQESWSDLLEATKADSLQKVASGIPFLRTEAILLGGVSVYDMKGMCRNAYTNYSFELVDNVVGVSMAIFGEIANTRYCRRLVRDANNVLPHEMIR